MCIFKKHEGICEKLWGQLTPQPIHTSAHIGSTHADAVNIDF